MNPRSPTRRSVLRSCGLAATAGLAGCTSLFGARTTELVVHNDREASVRVVVSVTNPSRDEPVLDAAELTVDAGAEATLDEELPRLRNHRVTVDVDDAPSETFPVDEPAAVLHVYVKADGIDFVVGGDE